MAVEPSDMFLFAAVVRDGSFTAAAAAFGVSKQSVSERIAKLEAELGVRLLERTTRRLRVTDAGARYVERCLAIAALCDEANSEARAGQAEPSGRLWVSAPVLYGRRFLGPVVADFLGRYGDVRVELVLADRRVDLVADGIDLAIRIGELDDSTLTARKLGVSHIYYVASPAFCDVHDLTRGAVDPRTVRCVGTRAVESWTVAGTTTKVDPVLVVNDFEVACDAASAGLGIARLPAIVCREAVLAGRLVRVFPDEPALMRTVYAVYPSRAYLPAKVRVFIDTLAALVTPMEPLPTARRSRRP